MSTVKQQRKRARAAEAKLLKRVRDSIPEYDWKLEHKHPGLIHGRLVGYIDGQPRAYAHVQLRTTPDGSAATAVGWAPPSLRGRV